MAIATTHRGIEWAARLFGALLILALGYVIVKTIITFTNPESAWEQPTIAPVSSQNMATQRSQSFNFTTDPFNRLVPAEPEALVEVGEGAPETTLNLKLTGRTAGANGTVILRTPDNKEGNYRLGDEIVAGVTLEAVNKDFIVLDVDGEMQRLTFERGDDTGLVKRMGADEDAPQTALTVKVPSRSGTGQTQTATIASDVSQLFQNVSLRRVMKDGYLTGYSVKANRPGVDLTPLGFSKGDVITNIGGTDITIGRPDFMALFEQAEKNGGIDITVLRNGQIRTIKLGTP